MMKVFEVKASKQLELFEGGIEMKKQSTHQPRKWVDIVSIKLVKERNSVNLTIKLVNFCT
jgi:hypothetical protein